MSMVLKDRFYTKTHEWILIQGELLTIGISDHAQSELGDLVFADVAAAGKVIAPGDVIGSVESVKMASDLYSPAAGTIVESNGNLGDTPEQINQDPYGIWFVRIKTNQPPDVADWMSADAYEAFCQVG